VVQFLVPWVVGFTLLGTAFLGHEEFVDPKKGIEKDIWLHNAGIVFIPWVLLGAFLAWRYLKSVPVKANFRQQTDIFREKHTWIMTALYIMTFGAFSGFAAQFPLLIKNLYGGFENAPDPLRYAFLGPLVGSAARVAWGPLCDRFGGAVWTLVSGIGMTASTVFTLFWLSPESMGEFTWFVLGMLAIFLFAGIGNAATFKQMPMIFDRRQAGGVIGWTAAIAAYGPFVFGVALASIAAPTFFLACAALLRRVLSRSPWYYYAPPRRRAPQLDHGPPHLGPRRPRATDLSSAGDDGCQAGQPPPWHGPALGCPSTSRDNERLRAAGAQQHSTGPAGALPRQALYGLDVSDRALGRSRDLSTPFDVDQPPGGSRSITAASSPQRLAGRPRPGGKAAASPVRDTVAGGRVVSSSTCPRLLPAEGEPRRPSWLQQRSDRRPRSWTRCTPSRSMASPEAQVRHHGGPPRCPGRAFPASRIASASTARISVAVDHGSGGVDGQAAVGVPVVRDPGRRRRARRPPRAAGRGGSSPPVVDVEAVGLRADRDDVGAGGAQHGRRDG
jgi:hypothetical protein